MIYLNIPTKKAKKKSLAEFDEAFFKTKKKYQVKEKQSGLSVEERKKLAMELWSRIDAKN